MGCGLTKPRHVDGPVQPHSHGESHRVSGAFDDDVPTTIVADISLPTIEVEHKQHHTPDHSRPTSSTRSPQGTSEGASHLEGSSSKDEQLVTEVLGTQEPPPRGSTELLPDDVSQSASDIYDPARWHTEKLLGRGAFGVVHMASNDQGQRVAIKTISFNENDRNVLKQLQLLHRELKTLRKVGNHPNIVKYYRCTRRGMQVHMFMELCAGGSIKALYDQTETGLPPAVVATYTKHILSGLQFLHDLEVVHRDIKCDNILIDSEGTAKLADFGAAAVLGPNAQRTTIGTVYWMAPEVVMQTGHRWQADIWSLGCAVMEMLTAKRPFHGICNTYHSFVKMLAEHSTPPLSVGITEPLARDFILSCLQKDPSKRPSCATLSQHPFVTKMAMATPPSVTLLHDPCDPTPNTPTNTQLSTTKTSSSGNEDGKK
eukprot:TRINITY_DN64409_c0_g1_i1.p1 TRINITY_DN64409_c0_g1~~TRINITY_DN64409_c0_g1_i1.p1  ORF type:complete len:428 (-),score=3.70 TRINITY_DN64409_c0_g1_i1:206-1489(-)